MLHDLTKSFLNNEVKLDLLYHSFDNMPYGSGSATEIVPLNNEDFNTFLKAVGHITMTSGLNKNEIKFLSIMCSSPKLSNYKFGKESIGWISYYFIDLRNWKSKRCEINREMNLENLGI